jgi:hypothetical protein
MNERKIIQISLSGVNNTSSTQCDFVAMALCDDGSTWLFRNNDKDWFPLPDIPKEIKR